MLSFQSVQILIKTHFFSVVKFGVVGAITALIYFSVMWIASAFLKFSYIFSVSVAYLASTIFHYLANRYFTFAIQAGESSWQLVRYIVLWVVNYMITIIMVSVSVEYFGLSAYWGVCEAILVTALIGYFLSRNWVFKIRGVVV